MPTIPPVPVVLIEDDVAYREGLAWLIASDAAFDVCATYGTAEAALQAWAHQPPRPGTLVVLDLTLPGMDGRACLRQVRRRWPALRLVVLSMHEDAGTVLEALHSGADGYLVKSTPGPAILTALHEARQGGSPLSGKAARYVLQELRSRDSPVVWPGRLSPRERDVLAGLMDGLTYRALAGRLGIRLDTVRSHIKRLYEKLGVHSRHEAVALAHRRRLLPPGGPTRNGASPLPEGGADG